ncbi:hypothetical protein KY314_00605 [Candidatus Woesearchaeota archaeon]|nr:hypothetical protein [Candidatus Woesearchaeota archaeon]
MAKKKVKNSSVDLKLNKIIKTLKRLEQGQIKELIEEKEQTEDIEELKALEKQIAAITEKHPLRRITIRDLAKGSLGAFIGVVAHYTFIYGIKVAEHIDMVRATILFPLAFILGGVFLYATGYRKIRVKKIIWFLPVRLVILYLISIITATLVLLLFLPEFMHNFTEAYKQLAAVTLTAMIGACVADLIGGNE